jgi:Tfp pilus assembly protein FimT
MAEMVVVVFLVGIVLTVSTSAIMSVRRNSLVRGGVDSFVAKYSLARATAVRMGRMSLLRADPVKRRLWIEVNGAPVAGSDTYLEVNFTTNRTILCFDARGLATTGGTCQSPDATFVFIQGGRSDTLRTTLLGRVLR